MLLQPRELDGVLLVDQPCDHTSHDVVAGLQDVKPRKRGQVLLETSTLPLADKKQAEAVLRTQRRVMLDAPISGTATDRPAQAWIMYLSGPPAACRQVRPWVSHFTLDAPRVGATGSGSKLKLAANHHVAILNVACAEMVAFCRKMGLDPHVALRHMGHSPYIGTGLMRIRMPMMLDRRYQPATMKIGVWQKDMQIIGDMAREVDCPTPLFNASAALYTAAMAMGLAEHDTAATAEVLAALSGQPKVGALRLATRPHGRFSSSTFCCNSSPCANRSFHSGWPWVVSASHSTRPWTWSLYSPLTACAGQARRALPGRACLSVPRE